MSRHGWMTWLALSALTVACGQGVSSTNDGSRTDSAAAETGDSGAITDTAADIGTGSDAATDVADVGPVSDGGSDVGADGGLEADVGMGPEVGGDAGSVTDVGTDTLMMGGDVVSDTGPVATPFGAPCTSATPCAAEAGQTPVCAAAYGTPVCVETCTGLDDFALCENGAGICVPLQSGTRVCVPKCGDAENRTCGAGAACAFIGYRDNRAIDAGISPVGACVPSCSAGGTDACLAPGSACQFEGGSCATAGCPSGCPTGSHCSGATCAPDSPIGIYQACSATPAGTPNGCADNICAASGANPGYCTIPCDTTDATTACGTGGVCWIELDHLNGPTDGGTYGYPLPQFDVFGGRITGICVKGCAIKSDCPIGFTCEEFDGQRGCVPDTEPQVASPGNGTVLAGGACRADADCASGHCSIVPGGSQGFCQRASMTQACPTGTVSANDGITCVPTCTGTTDNECQGAAVCSPSTMQCALGLCRDSRDCATGYTCNPASSTCVMGTPSSGAAVGQPCASMTDCAGGVCITMSPSGDATVVWPGGYCSSFCDLLPDLSDTCPSGTICLSGHAGVASVCGQLCDADPTVSHFGGCRLQYHCQAFTGDPRYGLCVPLI